MIISTNTKKKNFGKIQHPFMVRLSKLRREGNVFNPLNDVY